MLVCASCGHENSEGARFCQECGLSFTAASARSQEQRKTVTVLFCDVTGSTELGESLDAERLRALLARYFERMKAIVERHGGSVEKFIGDAVMAVFGVPVLHEDDALRAVRAAVEMRDALPELGLGGRIGVMTGEVVTGTQERLATGDAVNVSARLQQAAQPGEVLVGASTLALVREAAEVEQVEPLVVKGKAAPVLAFRLLRVGDAWARRHMARFVGRELELTTLQGAWERVRDESGCELVPVVGEAGVGKSRLVAELLDQIEATAIRARCPPYGEGITYWPVVEVLKQLDVLPAQEGAAAAIRSLLGETEARTSAEEILWAFRKTLERAAADRPLAIAFDDIQWGEETFLDLIEHVALLSTGAPILLVCLARPELAERRPAWPVALRLEPLADADVDQLIPEQIGGDLREKIARAAGGNPLFVAEMLAMAAQAEDEVVVPPTLWALLGARLDQLETGDRRVLERAAIEGEIFHRGAVQALMPDELRLSPRLAALVRKELISPDRAQLAGEDAFRFRHLLIRDAAYETLPKAARVNLHQGYATWLEERGAELVERDEILGYHLEQACSYRTELGMSRDEPLAEEATRRLSAGGHRAYVRADFDAATNLLERAAALALATKVDLALETDLIEALFWAGRGRDALRRAESLADRAAAAGDRVAELCGRIKEEWLRLFLEPKVAAVRLDALVGEALPVFQAARDDVALYVAYNALAWVGDRRMQAGAALEAYERAVAYAPEAGQAQDLLAWRAASRFIGPTPVSEFLTWLEEPEQQRERNHWVRRYRAGALAMVGRFADARMILGETRADLAKRGRHLEVALFTAEQSLEVELLAGDPATAAELGAQGCRQLEQLGEHSFQSTTAANVARALYELGRLEQADAWADRAMRLAASDAAAPQMGWRQVRAKILARRGAHAEAEQFARDGVAIADETDCLNAQGDTNADLAEVLLLSGKAGEAAAALEQALERYERKGNLVMARRTSERLTAAAVQK